MPEPEKRDESWVRALMKSRVERLSNGGGAMQASSIGFVLGGSVAAGFFAGSWLDARFKTGFWMPLLTVLGVFGGFYQMLQMPETNRRGGKNRRRADETQSRPENFEWRAKAARRCRRKRIARRDAEAAHFYGSAAANGKLRTKRDEQNNRAARRGFAR